MVFFSDTIEKYIPPKKGKQHALYIVRNLLTTEAKSKGTSLSTAIRYLNNSTRQKTIVFVLSDFLDDKFEDALRVAEKKHDVIGIKVYDKMDMQLPDVGLLQVADAETGATQWVDSSDYNVQQQYQQHFFNHTEWCKQVFLRAGSDLLHVRTDEDYVKILQKFFIGRS